MKLRAVFACLGLALPVNLAPASEAADYGGKVSFEQNAPVTFPDFILTYLGERRVATAHFPRGFIYHDFRLTAPLVTQTVSWSSGTGEISPAYFHVGQRKFALELRRADKHGPLKANELVISRVSGQ